MLHFLITFTPFTHTHTHRECILYTGKWYETRELYDPDLPYWNLLDSNGNIITRNNKSPSPGKRKRKNDDRRIMMSPPSTSNSATGNNNGNNNNLNNEILMIKKAELLIEKRGLLPNDLRFIDSLIYGLSLTLGYLLMLIIMTYNIWLCITVIIGYIFGRLIFWIKMKQLNEYIYQREKEILSILTNLKATNHEFSNTDTFHRVSHSITHQHHLNMSNHSNMFCSNSNSNNNSNNNMGSPYGSLRENASKKIDGLIDKIGTQTSQAAAGFGTYFNDGSNTVGLRN